MPEAVDSNSTPARNISTHQFLEKLMTARVIVAEMNTLAEGLEDILDHLFSVVISVGQAKEDGE